MLKSLFITLILSTASYAAMPPFFQSSREINAILANTEVQQKLGTGRNIHSIVHEGNNYSIIARECGLTVTVVYIPTTIPGPAQFKLKVGQVNCLPE